VAIGLGLACNIWATIRVRAWNLRREPVRSVPAETEPQHGVWGSFRAWEQRTTEIQSEAESRDTHTDTTARAADATRDRVRPQTRRVWDNPVLWREVRTWAYGRRMLIIRLIYLGFFALSSLGVYYAIAGGGRVNTAQIAASVTPLLVLSLVLVNTQAVTALTSERDARTLDLLLVTRLEAKDIIYGKLSGIFYNTKEIVLLPMLLAGYLWWVRVLSLENLCYL
jgi:hypothetical protein